MPVHLYHALWRRTCLKGESRASTETKTGRRHENYKGKAHDERHFRQRPRSIQESKASRPNRNSCRLAVGSSDTVTSGPLSRAMRLMRMTRLNSDERSLAVENLVNTLVTSR